MDFIRMVRISANANHAKGRKFFIEEFSFAKVRVIATKPLFRLMAVSHRRVTRLSDGTSRRACAAIRRAPPRAAAQRRDRATRADRSRGRTTGIDRDANSRSASTD